MKIGPNVTARQSKIVFVTGCRARKTNQFVASMRSDETIREMISTASISY
jgi:hypothetical protein